MADFSNYTDPDVVCRCGHKLSAHAMVHPCGCDKCNCPSFGCISFETKDKESVDHPQHYGGANDPFEHIKVCEAKGWGYHLGNCTKYIWRLGLKDPAKELEDAKKARWYLDRYIQMLEGTPNDGK